MTTYIEALTLAEAEIQVYDDDPKYETDFVSAHHVHVAGLMEKLYEHKPYMDTPEYGCTMCATAARDSGVVTESDHWPCEAAQAVIDELLAWKADEK